MTARIDRRIPGMFATLLVLAMAVTWSAGSAGADAPGNDLALELAGFDSPVPAGVEGLFPVRVHAVGAAATEDVTVTVSLPDGFTYKKSEVFGSTAAAVCAPTAAPRQVACDLGTITVPTTGGPTVEVTFVVGPHVAPDSRLRINATVSGSSPDPDSTNNDAYEVVRVQKTATLIASVKAPVIPRGGSADVTLTILNKGPDTASGLAISVYIYPRGILSINGPTEFTGGSLAPGHTLTYVLHASATSGSAAVKGTLDVIAGSHSFDPSCSDGCAQLLPLSARRIAFAPVGHSHTMPMGPGCGGGLAETGIAIGELLLIATVLIGAGVAMSRLGRRVAIRSGS